jgi:phosphoglycerol transferase MdoB-like AlkP superfamily enzyme
MFEFLVKTFEAQKDDPLFIFGVTMQNHGGYNYEGDNYTQQITVDDLDKKYPDAEQYLSLIHETDKAVEYMITYFQSVDEDVVILFYGDHQPKLDEAFYEAIGETTVDTLDEQQKRYKVPFFIWANYDIEERNDIDCNSLNYLSSYVYDVAGIELPPYNKFLQDMENVVPAMNANGFYSPAAEGFLPFDEANEEEKKWLGL